MTATTRILRELSGLAADTVSPTRIALFANHAPGLEVAAFLANRSQHDQVCALYLTGEQPENDKRIIEALDLENSDDFLVMKQSRSRNTLNGLGIKNLMQ